MFEARPLTATGKPAQYRELARQVQGLLHGERNLVANAANFAALVFHALPDLNWCGFYLAEGDELVVGPFQGKPACVRIAFGRGVCGTAAATRQTVRSGRSVRSTHQATDRPMPTVSNVTPVPSATVLRSNCRVRSRGSSARLGTFSPKNIT